jgi:hypothetical protein
MARDMPPATAEAGPSRPRGAPSCADSPDRERRNSNSYSYGNGNSNSNASPEKRKRPGQTLDNVFVKQSQVEKRRVNEKLRELQAKAAGELFLAGWEADARRAAS